MKQFKIDRNIYNYIGEGLADILLSWFATAYFYLSANQILGLELPVFLPLLAGFFLLIPYTFVVKKKNSLGLIIGLAFYLLPAISFFLYGVGSQWKQLVYDAGEALSDYGLALGDGIPVAITHDYKLFCGSCVCFWIGTLILFLSNKNRRLVYFLGLVFSLALVVRLGIALPVVNICLLLCWGICAWTSHVACGFGFSFAYVVMAFLMVIVLGNQNSGGSLNEAEHSAFQASLENFRFGNEDSYLKNGRISMDSPETDENKLALKITMNYPQSMYLRGYVGNVFSEDSWKAGTAFLKSRQAGLLNDSENLLDEMAKEGYYSQNQMEHVARIDGKISDDNQNVLVENVGADRRYLYTPYEVGADFFSLTDGRVGILNQTEVLLATGYKGQTSYQYHVISPFSAWKRIWLRHRNQFRIAEDTDSSDENYGLLYKEQLYKEYVYRCFLSLGQDTRDCIANANGIDERYSGNITPIFAVEAVRAWVSNNLTYDKKTGYDSSAYPSVDAYLFSGNAKGGDDSYATAAVLLFRYMGIPSRYVEGYVVTTNKADAAIDNQTIELMESDAHAWAEIYIDELGWIPVEVLPDYIGVMNSYLPDSGSSGEMIGKRKDKDYEQTDDTEDAKETKTDSSKGKKQDEQDPSEASSESPEDTTATDADPSKTQNSLLNHAYHYIWIPSIILGLLLIVLFGILGYWNHIKTRKRRLERKWRHTVNDRRAVLMWYKNLECVSSILVDSPLKKEGLLEDNRSRSLLGVVAELDDSSDLKSLEKVFDIRQRAIYSQNDVSREERRFVAEVCEKQVKTLEQKLSLRGKIIYTFVASRLSL